MKLVLPHPMVIRSFAEQMHLNRSDEFTFQSTLGALPWGGEGLVEGELRARAYGGHVFAQAVWAASHTVPRGFLVHSVTGYWVTQGVPDEAFEYKVHVVRDGKRFCIRRVDAYQPGLEESQNICFSCTSSFKGQDLDFPALEFQADIDVKAKYESVLKGKGPEDLPSTNDLKDGRDFMRGKGSPMITPSFPGVKMSLIPMEAFNRSRSPMDRRTLYYHTAIGPLPPADLEPNLHACAHLYASDRESLFVVLRHLGVGKHCQQLKSLSQTVIIHSGIKNLATVDNHGRERWFSQEVWTDRVGDTRCVHHSHMRDNRGIHIATTIQDGLMKLSFTDEAERLAVEALLHNKSRL